MTKNASHSCVSQFFQYDRQFYIFYEYPIKQNQAYIKELREAENPQPQTTRDEWGNF